MGDSHADPILLPEDNALALARAELAALGRRVLELEQDNAALQQKLRAQHALVDSERLLRQIIDNCPSYIFVKDCAGRYLLVNRALEPLYRVTHADIQGKDDFDFWPRPIAEVMRQNDREVIESKKPLEREEVTQETDGQHTYLSVKFPVFDSAGALVGVCGIATDITDRKRAEKERERTTVQQEQIAAQQLALRELSSPLIPLAEGVVVMPLIGLIDAGRAGQIMEALLEGVTRLKSHTAIIDITGVRVVDSHVAGALIKTAWAARLLGAQVVLTGVGATVAQTLVQLGTDLQGLVTLSTLQSGIAYALEKVNRSDPSRR